MNILDDSVKNINISNIYIFINNRFKVTKPQKIEFKTHVLINI